MDLFANCKYVVSTYAIYMALKLVSLSGFDSEIVGNSITFLEI